MNKGATLQFIVKGQQRWVESRHLTVHSNGRVSRLEDNLFAPLHAETRAEFEAGDGDEFGTAEKAGKMYSLYSSSALVCNVFDHWRKRPMLPLLRACGVGSRPANLDVLIADSGGNSFPVAIKSKFTEPFQSGERDCLKPSYLRKPGVWDELPNCRGLAESLTTKERFKCLKSAQLLKHTLALTRQFGKKRFVLFYLWYDVPGSEAAKQHRDEVKDFEVTVSGDILFRSDSYQSVFERLSRLATDTPYEEYLRSRYFR